MSPLKPRSIFASKFQARLKGAKAVLRPSVAHGLPNAEHTVTALVNAPVVSAMLALVRDGSIVTLAAEPSRSSLDGNHSLHSLGEVIKCDELRGSESDVVYTRAGRSIVRRGAGKLRDILEHHVTVRTA